MLHHHIQDLHITIIMPSRPTRALPSRLARVMYNRDPLIFCTPSFLSHLSSVMRACTEILLIVFLDAWTSVHHSAYSWVPPLPPKHIQWVVGYTALGISVISVSCSSSMDFLGKPYSLKVTESLPLRRVFVGNEGHRRNLLIEEIRTLIFNFWSYPLL